MRALSTLAQQGRSCRPMPAQQIYVKLHLMSPVTVEHKSRQASYSTLLKGKQQLGGRLCDKAVRSAQVKLEHPLVFCPHAAAGAAGSQPRQVRGLAQLCRVMCSR